MDTKLYDLMDWPEIETVVYSEEDNPYRILGAHLTSFGVLIQTFQPDVKDAVVKLMDTDKMYPMELVDEAGFYAVLIEEMQQIPRYQFVFKKENGKKVEQWDAYSFTSILSENAATNQKDKKAQSTLDVLGAYPTTLQGVAGVYFAVWAPNAIRVSVVGEFNAWDGRVAQMQRMSDTGIFSLFIPECLEGLSYQFEIKYKGNLVLLKSDPCSAALHNQLSVVTDLEKYDWQDKEWLASRKNFSVKAKPFSVCQIDLEQLCQSEDKELNYREFAVLLGDYLERYGYSHVQLNTIMEHDSENGDDKIIAGFYAPMSRFGTPADFMFMVDYLHQKNLGVILTWTPAYFSKNSNTLACFDGTCLYEHQNPKQGLHGKLDAFLFNYGREEVRSFLIGSALFWIEKYHIDGLHVNDVAAMLFLDYEKEEGQWVPNALGGKENFEAISFLRELNQSIKAQKKGTILIASETGFWSPCTDFEGERGLGFDLVVDAEWNRHFYNFMKLEPKDRQYCWKECAESLTYIEAEQFLLPLFGGKGETVLSAEVVKELPGNEEQKAANLKLLYGYQYMHPGKKLDSILLDEDANMADFLHDLNQLYLSEPALYKWDNKSAGFGLLRMNTDNDNVLAFTRNTNRKEELLLIIMNFSDQKYAQYQVGVPYEGAYKELFASDSKDYGGGGTQNIRRKSTKKEEANGKPYSLKFALQAYSFHVFRYQQLSKPNKPLEP